MKVGDLVYLNVPAVKTGQTKKLHSPWTGPYKVIRKISDVTYRIEDVQNRRKRKVLHFNRLKQCVDPVPMDPQPDQPVNHPSSMPVRRSHTAPPYIPDDTDLMYSNGTTEDGDQVSTEIGAEILDHDPIVEEVPRPLLDRPRREVHAPSWMRDFVP